MLVSLAAGCTPGAAVEDTAEPGFDSTDDEGEEPLVAPAADDLFGLRGVEPQRLDPVPIEPNEDPGGGLMKVQHDDEWVALVLQESAFDTHVIGTVAETTVTQMFVNPFDTPIEAIYQFPLPEDSAVDDYWFHLGRHHVHGEMKKRDEARQIYEDAKREGKSASLLDQERPNLFTQSVANIPPGETIIVEMHMVQPLRQKDGQYTLALPTTIGPRFIPGAPIDEAGNTAQVPDADKVTPPTLPPGMRNGSDLSISIHVDTPMQLAALGSSTHTVRKTTLKDGASLDLLRKDAIPNKDFVARWKLAGKKPQVALQIQEVDDEHFFALTLQPPERVTRDQARARELIFVVDNSCSMSGVPIGAAKDAMHRALDDMGKDDRFQVLRFSESASGLAPGPIPPTPSNKQRAHDYVTGMHGMGGTQMIAGVEAALNQPHDPKAIQMVLFMTDGYIGNEEQIFAAIDEDLGDTRLFSMGVGSSVNRYLLDGMADLGRGTVTYMGPEATPEQAVKSFYETIGYPVLTDVDVDWGGLPVDEVVPGRIPDLFSGQPVVVYGKLGADFDPEAAGKVRVKLRGKLGDDDVTYPIDVDFADADGRSTGIASLWARERISDLARDKWLARSGPDAEQLEAAITDLALEHAIMTEYTSFVAVLHERQTDGEGTTVYVPNEMPQGATFAGDSTALSAPSAAPRKGALKPTGGGQGVGTLGLVGTGRGGGGIGSGSGSGYGRGAGAGFGSKGKRVPRVRQAKAQVTGSLDKDIIRRIVRAHINEVRGCYNEGLSRDPAMAGKLSVKFTIGADGKVIKVEITGDTLGDDKVGTCLEKAIKRWKFPQPAGGGVVEVSYPFVLSPG